MGRVRAARALAPMVAVVLAVACGDDTSSGSSGGGGAGGGGGTGTTAIYGDPLRTPLLPFPSNRYTTPDPGTRTGLRVRVAPDTTADPLAAQYPIVVQRFGELDGFSTAGGFAFGFDRPLDGASFAGPSGGVEEHAIDPAAYTAAGSPLLLVDVDPASPERGRAIGLLPRYYDQAKDAEFLVDEFTIVARPAEPLAPGRRYLAVGTRALHDATGRAVERNAASEALLGGTAAAGYDAEVQSALAVLEDTVGLSRDEVVVATLFTTETVHDELVALADAARAAPPPEPLEPWTVEMEGEGDDRRVRFRAVFGSQEYRDAATGTFVPNDGGAPLAQDLAPIEVFLVFADRDVSGPRPLVIFQHGLGGDKDGCWGTAERLADLGAAVVSIDSPEHGSRGDGANSTLNSVFAFFGIEVDTLEFDLGRARDNFRQMAADQLELVRFLGTQGDLDLLPVGAPDGEPDLEMSELLYIGHSFGSVQGPTVFALAPEIRHAVWNVGGDHLTLMMEDSATFSVLVGAIAPAGTSQGALARFFSAAQAIVDPGDPLNYARFALREPGVIAADTGPRSVLLQEVIDDNIVPNSSTEVLARATGLSVLRPVRPVPGLGEVGAASRGEGPNGSTAVLAPFATMNGGEKASHGELIFADEARDQYVEFFRSGLEDGVATVE